MSDAFARVTIRVLEKDYQVACPVEEEDDLKASAALLNQKMREIRDGGKVVGLDRVAVMAALNLAHELLQTTRQDTALKNNAGTRIKSLRERIETTLGPIRQLNL